MTLYKKSIGGQKNEWSSQHYRPDEFLWTGVSYGKRSAFSKIILQKRNPIAKHKSTTFHTIHTTMLSVHISHWLMTVLIAVSYATGGYLNFFSKCFTILRILARAVSFFCRPITLALLNFCVSSHLHCSVRLTQVELSADTANTTGGSGNRAARCVRL